MNELEIKNKFEEAEKMYLSYFEKGEECDLKHLYEIFNEYADKYNDANAKYYLGEMYYYGLYVDIDDEVAYYIFRELKDFYGDIRAKLYLGKMYYFGKYVKKDYKKAYSIFNTIIKKSGKENNTVKATAQYYIGRMYYYGHYLQKNSEKSFKMFNKTLDSNINNVNLIINLKYYIAVAYYYGEYVEQDYNKAFEIFSELSNDKYSKCYLGEMYYYGRAVEQDYKKAFEIFNEISFDEHAQYYLGRMYENGEYVEKNMEKAMELYKMSAEANDKDAVRRLIEINEEQKNEEEVIKYCDKLILLNDDMDAKIKMIEIYNNRSQKILKEIRDDNSLPYIQAIQEKTKKAQEAVENLKKAIKYGGFTLKFELAFMYVTGEFIEENVEEGLKLYEELAKNSDETIKNEAKYVLGQIYYEGEENEIDIKSNKEKGIRLLKEAAEGGNKRAIKRLKEIEKLNNKKYKKD